MTPRQIRMEIEAYWKRRKSEWERSEYQAWLTGYFTIYSIGINLSKKVKFPDNPLNKEIPTTDVSQMNDEEIANIHEGFLERLDLMSKMAIGGK